MSKNTAYCLKVFFSIIFCIIATLINLGSIADCFDPLKTLPWWKKLIKSTIIFGMTIAGGIICNNFRPVTGFGYGMLPGALAGLTINYGL